MIEDKEPERIPLADMKPAAYNPRKISDPARKGLRRSLEKFGLLDKIVWNKRSGNIVGGHQRYKELVDAGNEDAWAIVVDLDPTDEKVLNVVLNNKEIAGEFDEAMLGPLFDEIRDAFPRDDFLDLRLDVLDPVSSDAAAPPPEEFPSFGEDIETQHECPRCGYAWSGKADQSA